MNAIEATELRYSVRPHFWAKRRELLRGVTFHVDAGETFGFLGPNGAGKTTSIKALLGLLRPDAGSVRVFGAPPAAARVRRRLGFMPERAYFPEHLTARELLVAHGMLAGLTRSAARRRAAELLARVGLEKAAGDRIGTYSKGMQQRVGLAQALVGDPELVILDEPMSGLDPVGRYDVRELLTELRAAGKTVFFSTHIIPDVEALCDRVAILVAGSVRRTDRLGDLLSGTTSRVEIAAERCPEPVLAVLRTLGTVAPRGAGHMITAASSGAANAAIDALRAGGVLVHGVQTQRRSLEDVFVDESRAGKTEVT